MHRMEDKAIILTDKDFNAAATVCGRRRHRTTAIGSRQERSDLVNASESSRCGVQSFYFILCRPLFIVRQPLRAVVVLDHRSQIFSLITKMYSFLSHRRVVWITLLDTVIGTNWLNGRLNFTIYSLFTK